MSEWEDFKTKCPSCDNDETIHWTIDQCHLIINKEGYIKCNNSSCQHNQNPTFIMEYKFKCGKHEDYRKPNFKNVWAALGMISSIANSSKAERTKLYKRISEYYD